jgi:hypothetical protein
LDEPSNDNIYGSYDSDDDDDEYSFDKDSGEGNESFDESTSESYTQDSVDTSKGKVLTFVESSFASAPTYEHPIGALTKNKELSRSLSKSIQNLQMSILSFKLDNSCGSIKEEEKSIKNLEPNDDVMLSDKFKTMIHKSFRKESTSKSRSENFKNVIILLDCGRLKNINNLLVCHVGDIFYFKPVDKWRFAIRSVIKLNQSLKNGPLGDTDLTLAIHSADNLLKMYKYVSLIVLSSKIQHYMTKPQLNEAERARVMNLITDRCIFFSSCTYEQKVHLFQYLSYQSKCPGTMVARQNNRCQDVYFILSGQVESFQKSDMLLYFDGRTSMGYINAGGIINQDLNEPTFQEVQLRTYSIQCKTKCEFLRIDRAILWNILSSQNTGRDIIERPHILKGLSIFQNCEEILIDQASAKTEIKYYDKNVTILVLYI